VTRPTRETKGDDVSISFDVSADIDALMARVRAAAAQGAGDSSTLKAIAADNGGRDLDVLQLIALQGEWNERTAKALATIVDCLQGLQEQWVSIEARLREFQAHTTMTDAAIVAPAASATSVRAVANDTTTRAGRTATKVTTIRRNAEQTQSGRRARRRKGAVTGRTRKP